MERRPDPQPYEGDVAGIVTVGTVLWAIALVVLLPFWSTLDHDGHLWWIPTCACGAGLGLLGRRSVLERDRRVGRTS